MVRAEDIQDDARRVFTQVWDLANLDFADHAFEWQSGSVPEGWERVAGWHGRVLASTGISSSANDAVEVFEKAAEKAPHLRSFLDHHEPYYHKLICASVG